MDLNSNHKQKKMPKHCSICAKAGYPEEVYSSHFIRETRDPASKVTCPVLKFNVCSKCGKSGHFRSSCKVVVREKPVVKVVKSKIETKNGYDFGSESDSEEEPEMVPEMVPMMTKKDTTDMFALNAWQKEFEEFLARPEDQRNNERAYWDETHKMFCRNGYVIVEKQVRTSSVVETIRVIKPVKSSWADDSDDE